MTEQADYLYDVFISHSQTDKEWVWDELLSRLENAGLKVILDERDFEPGAPLVKEKERAVLQSRKTLLVLSPAYVAGDWTEFESVLVQTLDPAARKRRLIPVVRVPCRLDLRIRPLVAVDLTAGSEVQWQRLLRALDPNQPPAANPIQNLALAITESAAPTAAPGWHPLGSAWLAAGLIGVVLLVGLVNLLLSEWPILQNTASIMAGVAVLLFGWLGLRRPRFFPAFELFPGQGASGAGRHGDRAGGRPDPVGRRGLAQTTGYHRRPVRPQATGSTTLRRRRMEEPDPWTVFS
ncbi:toll/interleukin-1 receptor domain-containing protein [Candidatus Amarolinea dominans]|uniref:toll/interleukin-1 receptor domain-containing protein n=1 Tax=Candidatus Amarolinea dominans TaxID=3140696 RepID=UPI0031CC79E7